jgi:hypothetical protein
MYALDALALSQVADLVVGLAGPLSVAELHREGREHGRKRGRGGDGVGQRHPR